jgi:Immunoglobulin-like domain of bacterial spore germination/Sporulation and spore germination
MKRLATLVAGLGLLTAACGSGAASSLGPAPSGGAPSRSPSGAGAAPGATASTSSSAHPATSPGQTSAAPTRVVGLQVWLIRSGKLFVTQRTEPYGPAVGTAALNAMLNGPTSAEQAAGLRSAIPAGTRLLSMKIASGTATVDFSSAFESAATASTMPARLAQVIYTITQFPTVTSVRFQIDGQGRTVIGGVPVQSPQTRAMFGSYLPAITVASPVVGAQVSSPVTISGTAAVFEAVVSVRVLDAAGNEIARTFTNATCGTGCRGGYSVAVAYSVSHVEPGFIEVFEVSAKDGTPVNVQSIPVTLVP